MDIDFKILDGSGNDYFVVVQKSGVDQVAFSGSYEAYGTSSNDISDYGIEATEIADSGLFQVDMPSGSSAGLYIITPYLQAGGSPAITDTDVNEAFQYDWSGSIEVIHSTLSTDISNIPNTGAGPNTKATIYADITGDESANTITDTVDLDGVRHQTIGDSGAMEVTYEFQVGLNGTPSSVTMTGFLDGSSNTLNVFGFNFETFAWDQVGVLEGQDGSSNIVSNYNLFECHVGTGANLGKVVIRFFAASGLTSATLHIDQIFASYTEITESISGTGPITFTYTLTKDGGTPVENASISVTSDESGNTTIAGPITTDSNGDAVFFLEAGNIFVWSFKAGCTFTNPDPEVVA